MKTLKDLREEMHQLSLQIDKVLNYSDYKYADDLSEIKYNKKDPDDLLLIDEYRSILEKLSDVQCQLKYLSLPVDFTDKLTIRPDGKYESQDNEVCFSSGSIIEFLTTEEVMGEDGHFKEMPCWRISRIEYDKDGYYIVGYKDVNLNGLTVRFRKQR